MTFQTLSFIALLLAVLSAYWLLRRTQQNILLLVASYVFYGYVDPLLTVLLGSFTLITYVAGIGASPAGSSVSDRRRRLSLGLSIFSVLALLTVFKYLGFFVDSASDFVESIGIGTFSSHLNIILPIGISFYSLQALGYVIDVYRGDVTARRNLLDFALFISFFPQLVSGPIERASRLLPQFESTRRIDADDVKDGVMLLLWGFFKKLVIADNVGVIADSVFATESPGFALLWVGVIAFGVQVFADFSGYTDIARGTARLFGIRLSMNFNHPHIASSPVDFWRRWHMSLSTWFRDYVYLPLGGSRRGQGRNALNLMATFLLSGLWHGASWNFVAWGGYHGVLVLGQRWLGTALPWRVLRVFAPRPVGAILTFLLITIGWLFFRESDMGQVWQWLRTSPASETAEGVELAAFLLTQVAIYSLPIWIHTLVATAGSGWRAGFMSGPIRAATSRTTLATALFSGVLLMRNPAGGEFIYFQF